MTMTHVDGVEIVARQKATGMTGSIAEGVSIDAVEELLLSDGRTVYHCLHKNANNCEYTANGVGSVTSHQRTHSDRMVAKRANEEAEALKAQLAAIEAEKAQKKANYAAGARKGNETKAAKRAQQLQTPSEVGGAGSGTHVSKKGAPSKSVVGDPDLARKAQQVILAYNALQGAHDEFQNVFLGYMRAAQVASEQPAIDPQILAKAKQYDVLQAAMKGLNI